MADEFRTESGIILPPTTASQGTTLTDRFAAEVDKQAAELTVWAQSWERAEKQRLSYIDIRQACMVRAQVWGWPPVFMKAVARQTCDALDLHPPQAQPENRQAKRARERREARTKFSVVPAYPPLDPQGDGRDQS